MRLGSIVIVVGVFTGGVAGGERSSGGGELPAGSVTWSAGAHRCLRYRTDVTRGSGKF